MYKKEDGEAAYDEKINISEERKAGRLLFDKNKEVLKTNVTSKATAINTSYEHTITPNSEKINSK